MLEMIRQLSSAQPASRFAIWHAIAEAMQAQTMLELGVWKGEFAQAMLAACPSLARYFMLDSWQHLETWNKPYNVAQEQFDNVYAEALARTDFAADRRVVLRGRTVDVIDRIADHALDLAYVDGDHTLRGIAIDLIRTYPKVRPGGVLGGDDLTSSIWQHAATFEPSLVFPFAVHFAEAVGAPIVILPHNQFAIVKPIEAGDHFSLSGLDGPYRDTSLLNQFAKRP